VRVNSLTEIALTKLDVLDDFDTIRVCIGYHHDGRRLRSYPDTSEVLGAVTCEYRDLPGWKQSLRQCRSESDLPASAMALVELVEQVTGVPVGIVGVGPERDDVVVRRAST
jgi:adenylosuccinate synthase